VTTAILIAVQNVNPPRDFYSTAATVIVTLFIAVAIEFRLLKPEQTTTIPEDPEEQKKARNALFWFLPWPVMSIVGLYAAMVALYQGGSIFLGTLVFIGVTATTIVFFSLSLRFVWRIAGTAIPSKWHKPLGLAVGGVLFVAGILILIFS
jgi:predicted anti-sigma-YlaC factor YlaD